MVNLRVITRENYMQCLKLRVKAEQKSFVASNAFSLVQAKYLEELTPLAIYDNDSMVGFLMYEIDLQENIYRICRLMIDESFQGRGYGEQAMRLIIEKISKDKLRSKIFISFESENKGAEALYTKLGFKHTGEVDDDGEIVMCLDY